MGRSVRALLERIWLRIMDSELFEQVKIQTPEILDFLERLGVAGHPGLLVNERGEGYRDHAFGCRAGPSKPNVHDLSHELAHASQFGARYFHHRASRGTFLFRTRKIFVYDRFCVEPRSNQATLRELDTFACQLHLLEAAGEGPDRAEFMRESARLMRLMPDWWLVPGDSEEERALWCESRIRSYFEKRRQQTVKRRLVQWLDATQSKLGAMAGAG